MSTAGNGYLCSIRPSVYAQHYEEHLPDSMAGADFLAKYHHHYDHATQVEPNPFVTNTCLLSCMSSCVVVELSTDLVSHAFQLSAAHV